MIPYLAMSLGIGSVLAERVDRGGGWVHLKGTNSSAMSQCIAFFRGQGILKFYENLYKEYGPVCG